MVYRSWTRPTRVLGSAIDVGRSLTSMLVSEELRYDSRTQLLALSASRAPRGESCEWVACHAFRSLRVTLATRNARLRWSHATRLARHAGRPSALVASHAYRSHARVACHASGSPRGSLACTYHSPRVTLACAGRPSGRIASQHSISVYRYGRCRSHRNAPAYS